MGTVDGNRHRARRAPRPKTPREACALASVRRSPAYCEPRRRDPRGLLMVCGLSGHALGRSARIAQVAGAWRISAIYALAQRTLNASNLAFNLDDAARPRRFHPNARSRDGRSKRNQRRRLAYLFLSVPKTSDNSLVSSSMKRSKSSDKSSTPMDPEIDLISFSLLLIRRHGAIDSNSFSFDRK